MSEESETICVAVVYTTAEYGKFFVRFLLPFTGSFGLFGEVVFTVTEKCSSGVLQSLEVKVREEAKRRGIKKIEMFDL